AGFARGVGSPSRWWPTASANSSSGAWSRTGEAMGELITLGVPASKVRLALTVNGEPRELLFDGYKTLLEVLREELGLTGTKHGRELGECGACAVLLDGQLVLSCLVAGVECQGRRVETVEGMQSGPSLHPLQAAFADHGAAQCGYCTPGFLLAAKELL